MGRTLAEKIWDAHVVRSAEGEPDLLYIDLHLLHEVTSPQAFDGLRAANRKVRRPDLTIATEDHNVPTTGITGPGVPLTGPDSPVTDPVSRTQVEALRKNCAEFGVRLHPMGDADQGIVHVIGPQLGLTQPGLTIVCGDSHTSTHGAHVLRLALDQRLRGEHMLDLGRADPVRERAECAVRRGVAVATRDRHARLGQPQLRPDDVHDALVGVAPAVERDAELPAVVLEGAHLVRRHRVEDRQASGVRRGRMVRCGDRQIRPAQPASGQTQTLECLRARDLMDEVAIDVEQAGAVRRLFHHVIVENFIVKRF